MAKRSRACTWLVSLWLALAWVAHAQAMPSPEPAPPDPAARNPCAIGMEKFLPGDYDYCLAAQQYREGRYASAIRFFRQAASWASKPAAYVLGTMALHGDHQPVDRPLALAWMALAAERHTPRYEQPYLALRASMTAAELAQADEDLRRLSAQYADRVAAPRAERRYQGGVEAIRHAGLVSAYCVAGQFDMSDIAQPVSGTLSLAQACQPTEKVIAWIDQRASLVFENWQGHVQVGPLQPLPQP